MEAVNPGIFAIDNKRQKQLARFHEAVNRSRFLNEEQRKYWKLYGHMLSHSALRSAEKLIISEDLRRFKMKHQLEIIKNKES